MGKNIALGRYSAVSPPPLQYAELKLSPRSYILRAAATGTTLPSTPDKKTPFADAKASAAILDLNDLETRLRKTYPILANLLGNRDVRDLHQLVSDRMGGNYHESMFYLQLQDLMKGYVNPINEKIKPIAQVICMALRYTDDLAILFSTPPQPLQGLDSSDESVGRVDKRLTWSIVLLENSAILNKYASDLLMRLKKKGITTKGLLKKALMETTGVGSATARNIVEAFYSGNVINQLTIKVTLRKPMLAIAALADMTGDEAFAAFINEEQEERKHSTRIYDHLDQPEISVSSNQGLLPSLGTSLWDEELSKLSAAVLKTRDLSPPQPQLSAPEITRPARNLGNSDAVFREELNQVLPHLNNFTRTLCGNPTDAADLAQDALMRAWDARGSYQLGTNMKAWVFMIARNQFYSEKRRSWRQTQLDQEAAERTLAGPPREQDSSADMEDFKSKIYPRLPREHRESLILVGFLQCPYEEAAAILNVPTGTIKSRVSRARRAARELSEITSAKANHLETSKNMPSRPNPTADCEPLIERLVDSIGRVMREAMSPLPPVRVQVHALS